MNIPQLKEYFKDFGTLKVKYITKKSQWEATIRSKTYSITGYPQGALLDSLLRLHAIVLKNQTELLLLSKE